MRRFTAWISPAAPVLHVAIGVVVLADVLRVFLPSLITIFGQAGGTPAEVMGLYAVSWFVGAFATVAVARLVPARLIALGAGLTLLVGRLGLQFTDGGVAQLYLASGTLFAGLCWLISVAIISDDVRPSIVGLVAGLAVASAGHAGLDTIDLIWRTGPAVAALLALELGALLFFVIVWFRGAASGSTPAQSSGAPRTWLAVGPAVLLWALYTGNTAHAQASAGWAPGPAAMVVAAAGMIAIAVAAQPHRWTRHPLIPAGALVVTAAVFAFGEVTVDAVHAIAPWWVVVAQTVGAVALAGCLGWATGTKSVPRPSRRGLAAAGGLLLFVVLVFAYYAAYDLYLPNDYVPILAAVVVAMLGVIRVPGSAAESTRGGPVVRAPTAGALAGAAAAIALVAAIPVWRSPGPMWTPATDGLRVAAYNIRMGFGEAGTLSLVDQADALRGLQAHVIALSEVDRGWMLNGGHDDLRLIADRLGMRYVWAPATDEVWGDALLTNLPIRSVRNHVLVQGGPTGAQALEVTLSWRGRDVTIIATHLQPPSGWRSLDQANQLAAVVRAAPRPVVLAGDLNLEPGDPAWMAVMSAGLVDPFAPARPFVTLPGPDAVKQIDHVLVSSEFTGFDPANPDVPYSDHRPIAVTLRLG